MILFIIKRTAIRNYLDIVLHIQFDTLYIKLGLELNTHALQIIEYVSEHWFPAHRRYKHGRLTATLGQYRY